MKLFTTMLAVTLAVAGCSGSGRLLNANAHTQLNELARKNGCSACHTIDTPGLGPSWQDVSERYKGKESYEYAYTKYSLEDGLVRKASLGGRHDWGEPIMMPNDPTSLDQAGIRQDDIRKMVQLILKLSPGLRTPATQRP